MYVHELLDLLNPNHYNMKNIQLIEINDDGKTKSPVKFQFENLPRLHEKIAIMSEKGEPRLYEVLDVHHTYDAQRNYNINVYVAFIGSLNNVIAGIARELV